MIKVLETKTSISMRKWKLRILNCIVLTIKKERANLFTLQVAVILRA